MKNVISKWLLCVFISCGISACAKKDCPPVYTANAKPSKAEKKIIKAKAKQARKEEKEIKKAEKYHLLIQDAATRKRIKKQRKAAEKRMEKRY